MRRAVALALCTVGCQFPPAALPDLGADASQPGDSDGSIDRPDAGAPDAEIPDAMVDAFTCPIGFVEVGIGCYSIHTDDLTWPDAEHACEALGGHLVIIDDPNENQHMTELATTASLFYPWIGLTDHFVENAFLWVNDLPPGYTNWNGGEPNNEGSWGGEEDCGQLRPEGNWNDSDCYGGADYICEWDGRPVGTIFW
jgi:hypothetical protein